MVWNKTGYRDNFDPQQLHIISQAEKRKKESEDASNNRPIIEKSIKKVTSPVYVNPFKYLLDKGWKNADITIKYPNSSEIDYHNDAELNDFALGTIYEDFISLCDESDNEVIFNGHQIFMKLVTNGKEEDVDVIKLPICEITFTKK